MKTNKDNKTFTCEFYKEGKCLKDKENCYLKEIHSEGLYFDCVKIIYQKVDFNIKQLNTN